MSKTEINVGSGDGDGCFLAICFILLLLCAFRSCSISDEQHELAKRIDSLNVRIEKLNRDCE